MSQPAVSALAPLPFELVTDDGVPVEKNFHVDQMSLLTHLIRRAMREQGRTDFFTGANLFVYYSVEQARQVALEVEQNLEQRAFRGPDIFWVGGVEPKRDREIWVAWEEGGRLPDVIVELLSPSTATNDRTDQTDLFARVFGTAEYYMYEQDSQKLGAPPVPPAHLPPHGRRRPGTTVERATRRLPRPLARCLGRERGHLGSSVPRRWKPGADERRSRVSEGGKRTPTG